MSQSVPWGAIMLHLDHEAFRQGFYEGRYWYFTERDEEDECTPGATMSSKEVLQIVAVPDNHGIYHFDTVGTANLPEYLGHLLGYMSGPLLSETPEEAQARIERDRREVVLQGV